MPSKNSVARTEFLKKASERFGEGGRWENKQMMSFAEQLALPRPVWAWVFDRKYRISRGTYKLPTLAEYENGVGAVKAAAPTETFVPQTPVETALVENKFDPNAVSEFNHVHVPVKDKLYVPFGEFKSVEQIVKSGEFFPVFISGLSGNGKTFMVQQICARAGREMVRVQVSRETDEDDLIGGFRLINGETKFMKGPVLRAMERGAILLIDEADRADPGKIMCLQGVLEGSDYFVKKTGEVIKPLKGFNVIVTANTKGKGSDDGRYVAAAILDDAWLERFPITIEQMYPSETVEKKILRGYIEDTSFIDNLVAWSSLIRKSYDEDGIGEVISTRRLVHIAKTFNIFGDRMAAIKLCINRFDEETKTAFLDLYKKVDDAVHEVPKAQAAPEPEVKEKEESDDLPF